jgi:hypothetical protein
MRTKSILATIVAVLAATALGAHSGAARADSIAGSWQLTVKGPAAHGDMSASMQLSQKGENVTGTLAAHGNEHTLKGTFAEGTLNLEATDVPHDKSLTLHGKVKEDGTLAGYLSGPMGDMQWTGVRAAARRP